PRVSYMLPLIIKHLKKANPEIIFSAGDHLNAIVILAAILCGSKAQISCSSRVTPFDTYSKTIFTKGWFLKKVMEKISWRADVLSCVSQDMTKQYKAIFRNSRHQCIYNSIVDKASYQKAQVEINEPWLQTGEYPTLIAAGQLEPWKGFHDLIHAIKYVERSQKVKLLILGDGSLRKDLELLIAELDLSDSIKMAGFVENPLSYFSQADIFVLSSHVEGLPNVLVEAMMCGCTPVSTDCPTGPREVLKDGKYGYLTPIRSPKALSQQILQAIKRPIPTSMLDDAIKPFSEKVVIKNHFKALANSRAIVQ
ncbi:glycosyltransferase, partial [Gammaproteobacteria bacterium]|nr:glycosyltransferase [Gammaproteobacteria bacterium]